ncbi:ATP-dependent DNA helicase [Rickenella mellea]|uniref:DNA 3'-5' helicase n=1 Tax=Rickenella mellea TaxID=50990 RepID=A0A4Y7QKJ2_9AGAM|nr:ATP-dependent DNA helicase [Rickenella mellea]
MVNGQGAQMNFELRDPSLFYKAHPDPEHHFKKFHIDRILSQLMGKNAVWQDGQEIGVMAAIRGTSGLDVLASFPTGSGKSLIYEVAGIFDSEFNHCVTVVFAPLVALMKDVYRRFYKRNVKAMIFHQDMPQHVYIGFISQLRARDYPVFIVITPERFKKNHELRQIIQNIYEAGNLARFVLDEVHCLLQCHWRPSYLELQHLRRDFVDVPILAMSASLSTDDIAETIHTLRIARERCILLGLSPNRPNLVYRIVTSTSRTGYSIAITDKKRQRVTKTQHIINFIQKKHSEKSGIIYCTTIGCCKAVSEELRKDGVIARAYYASLTDEEKSAVETSWMAGACHVIVATTAFGMGIDKPDVSFVIHYNMPTNLGDYYQESGRAGRNGETADCVIYYNFTDSHTKYTLGRESTTFHRDSDEKFELRKLMKPVHQVMAMCLDPLRCRRWQIICHLNPEYSPRENCRACDVCLGEHKNFILFNLHGIAKILVDLLIEIHDNDPESDVHPKRLVDICWSSKGSKLKSVARRDGWEPNFSFPNGEKITKAGLQRICEYLIVCDVFREYPRDRGRYGPDWYLAVRVIFLF